MEELKWKSTQRFATAEKERKKKENLEREKIREGNRNTKEERMSIEFKRKLNLELKLVGSQKDSRGRDLEYGANKGVGRKDGREGISEGESLEHVVWPCVRGKYKGNTKQREASMAEVRSKAAVIEQRKKGFPVIEQRV